MIFPTRVGHIFTSSLDLLRNYFAYTNFRECRGLGVSCQNAPKNLEPHYDFVFRV